MLIHGALPQDIEAIVQVPGQVLIEVMQLQEPIEVAPPHVELWVWIKTGHTEPVEAQEQYLDTIALLEVVSTLEAQLLEEVVHTEMVLQERKHREALRIEVLEVELGIPVRIEVLVALPEAVGPIEALLQEVAATGPEAAAQALEVVVAIEARAVALEVRAAVIEVQVVLQGHPPPQAEDLQVQEEVAVEDNKS